MNFDEGKLRGFLEEAAAEAPVAGLHASQIRSRAGRYQFFLAVSAIAAASTLVGGVVLAGGSLIGDEGPNVVAPSQIRESPPPTTEPSPSEEPSPQPSSSVPESALLTGNGRIPLGDLSLCPVGDLAHGDALTKDEVVAASRAVLEAANAPEPDTGRLWRLLDPSLQQAYGGEERFAEAITAVPLDDVFRDWRISDNVVLEAGPVLGRSIADTCGQEVAGAMAIGEAFFPQFEGLSGGAAQLYFVARDSGLRFWLSD